MAPSRITRYYNKTFSKQWEIVDYIAELSSLLPHDYTITTDTNVSGDFDLQTTSLSLTAEVTMSQHLRNYKLIISDQSELKAYADELYSLFHLGCIISVNTLSTKEYADYSPARSPRSFDVCGCRDLERDFDVPPSPPDVSPHSHFCLPSFGFTTSNREFDLQPSPPSDLPPPYDIMSTTPPPPSYQPSFNNHVCEDVWW